MGISKRAPTLSKSRLMKGFQCPKYLYLTVKHPDLATPTSPTQQAIFDQGHEVGILAQKQFPSDVLIDAPHNEPDLALQQTRSAIAAGALTLYEAAFIHDDVLVRVDILHRSSLEEPWEIVEVKSSTSAQEQHILDLSIQSWVLRQSGLKIKSSSLMHINRECVFPEFNNLFTLVNVTERTTEIDATIPAAIKRLKEMLLTSAAPPTDIGPHCDDPYECSYQAHCWKEKKVPELSVFNVPGLTTVHKWQLYRAGTVTLENLAKSNFKLKPRQKKMIEVSETGSRFLDHLEIFKELESWSYPLHYLDFETINPAVPRFTGTRPYQHIPFQFSCHIQQEPGGPLAHREYLHDDKTDPRDKLALALIEAIGTTGSVVAYNQGFESARISELAKARPQFASKLRAIIDRLVDPLPVIRAHVYDREFAGSFSIKSVAPALLGEAMSYEGMAVANGSAAQMAFEELTSNETDAERKTELRQAMLEYCKRDTLAMVQIVNWLRKYSMNSRK